MSDQLTPITPTEDPDEIKLHDAYAASAARAKETYTNAYQRNTEDYNERIAALREQKNPTPIRDLMRDMSKRGIFNERMRKISDQDQADLADILVDLTANPDLTTEAPNIFNMTNEEGAALDDLTATRANMRYLTGHSPQVIPTLLADPRLDSAIEAGNPELYRYTRDLKGTRSLPEDQQQRYHNLVTNRIANLTDADLDPANHTREDHGGLVVSPEENLTNVASLARRYLNSVPPTADPAQIVTEYQRFKPTIQTAVIQDAKQGFIDAYLFGRYVNWYRPIMPVLEAILTSADITVENIITEELKRRETRAHESAQAGFAFHLEHMFRDFPGMPGSRFGHRRSRGGWYGETDPEHAAATGNRHED